MRVIIGTFFVYCTWQYLSWPLERASLFLMNFVCVNLMCMSFFWASSLFHVTLNSREEVGRWEQIILVLEIMHNFFPQCICSFFPVIFPHQVSFIASTLILLRKWKDLVNFWGQLHENLNFTAFSSGTYNVSLVCLLLSNSCQKLADLWKWVFG